MCRPDPMAMRYDDHANSHYNNRHYSNHHNNTHYSTKAPRNYDYGQKKHKPSSSKAEYIRRQNEAEERRNERKVKCDKRSELQTKPKLREYGAWSEYQSSSGKKYYYNCKTEVSQWEKPTEWTEEEQQLTHPGIPSELNRQSTNSGNSGPSTSSSSSAHVNHNSVPSTSGVGRAEGGRGSKGRVERGDGDSSEHSSSSKSWQQPHSREREADRDRVKESHAYHTPQRSGKRERETSPKGEDGGGVGGGGGGAPQRKRPHSSASGSDRLELNSIPPTSSQKKEKSPERVVGGAEGVAETEGQVDLSRLPQLLVALAEQYGIDLNENSAVDELRKRLNQGKTGSLNCGNEGGGGGGRTEEGGQKDMDISHSCSTSSDAKASSSTGGAEEENGRVNQPPQDIPPVPPLTPSLVQHCRQDLIGHTRCWAAEHFEAQAWVLAGAALKDSVGLGQLSADLKCARSLVRTAEIRSTLLEQRILFVKQQYKQWDPQNKHGMGTSSQNSTPHNPLPFPFHS